MANKKRGVYQIFSKERFNTIIAVREASSEKQALDEYLDWIESYRGERPSRAKYTVKKVA